MGAHVETATVPAIPWKKYAAIVSAVYGIYKLFFDKSLPDAVFGFFLASLALALEYPPEKYLEDLRGLLKYGDRFARRLVALIAIGGTALVIKMNFGLQLIPDQLDFIFKRSAAPLIVLALTIYVASMLSKLTYYTTDVDIDPKVRKEELLFFVSALLFCTALFIWSMGIPEWDEWLGHKHDPKDLYFDPAAIAWSTTAGKCWKSAVLILLIWTIYFFATSKFFERIFRDGLRKQVLTDVSQIDR